ncbi:phosphotransferase [Georgenia alba]|uniref:Phosphotransferase n=1 Tax=Georgenia alba TaxID=2233858 RepID=A0ABW2QA76_9MICO
MVRSSLALAALATTAIPGLDVVATRPPQSTTTEFQTTGLLDAGGRSWVVRAPLTPAAGAALEGEVALLGQLVREVDEGRLPFDVPRPAGFAELPEGGRAMIHRALVGRPLAIDELTAGPGVSAALGRAIAAFHELDSSVVANAGLPVYDPNAYRTRRLAEVDEAARTGRVPAALLNRWEHALEDVRLWRFRPTPVHGDLAPEHVLVTEGRVSGVLGLSEVHVGDPAEDLAWLQASAPEEALDTIEEAYSLARTESADATLMDRALLVSELALARWLLHGVRTGEESVVEDAAEMLRVLAADVADAPEIGATERTAGRVAESAPHVAPREEQTGAEHVADDEQGDPTAETEGRGAEATDEPETEATADDAPGDEDEAPRRSDPAGVTENLDLGSKLPDFLAGRGNRDDDGERR